MKTTAFALLTLVAGLAATSAHAANNWAVGVTINNDPNYAPVYSPAPVYSTAPVYTPAPMYTPAPVYNPAPVVVAPNYAPAYSRNGYWRDETVKTWVPGHYNTGRDRWGRPVRVFEPGHYAFTTNRVWVDGRHDNRRDRWNR